MTGVEYKSRFPSMSSTDTFAIAAAFFPFGLATANLKDILVFAIRDSFVVKTSLPSS